jgi:hypothetical protein
MSKLSDLSVQIDDMLELGMEPETIARVLEIPAAWVFVEIEQDQEDSANWYNPNPRFDW